MISLETPHRKWASSRLEGRTSWIFLCCVRCSRLTTGTTGTRSGGLRKGQSPCELLGGLSGFLSCRCRAPSSCVRSVPETEDSSPVLIWILGVLLESPQGSQSSSQVEACTWAFLPSCSSSVTFPFAWIKGSVAFPRGFPRGFPTRLSHQAFPREFPTGLSHVPLWCELILSLKVEVVQGKQFSLEWTETSGGSGNGGTTLEFLSPFLRRAPPIEMRRQRREFFLDHAGKCPHLSS